MKHLRRRTIINIGFGLCLLIPMILTVVLYNTSTLYYKELNEVRLNPLGLDTYSVSTDEQTSGATNSIKVVFFGDSRAYQWPSPVLNERFQFFNRGIGTQTTAQLRLRFSAHVAPLQPNVVIVQAGINDLKTVPLFPEQKALIIANCEQNIAAIIAQARQHEATVILTTIFPTGDVSFARRLVWSTEIDQAIDEVNTYLHSLTNSRVILLDSAEILAGSQGKMRKEYQIDTLHINSAGYAALNQKLVPILASLAQ